MEEQLFEPHEENKSAGHDTLLTSKDKIKELESLLEEKTRESLEMSSQLKEYRHRDDAMHRSQQEYIAQQQQP